MDNVKFIHDPVAKTVLVEFPGIPGDWTLSIFTPDGKAVWRLEVSDAMNAIIPLGIIPSGIYIIRTISKGRFWFSQKIKLPPESKTL